MQFSWPSEAKAWESVAVDRRVQLLADGWPQAAQDKLEETLQAALDAYEWRGLVSVLRTLGVDRRQPPADMLADRLRRGLEVGLLTRR